jgi:alpha-glucosidase
MYRDAIALRRDLKLGSGEVEWLTGYADDVVALRNGAVTMISNLGETRVALPAGTIVQSSEPLNGRELPPNVTVWLA